MGLDLGELRHRRSPRRAAGARRTRRRGRLSSRAPPSTAVRSPPTRRRPARKAAWADSVPAEIAAAVARSWVKVTSASSTRPAVTERCPSARRTAYATSPPSSSTTTCCSTRRTSPRHRGVGARRRPGRRSTPATGTRPPPEPTVAPPDVRCHPHPPRGRDRPVLPEHPRRRRGSRRAAPRPTRCSAGSSATASWARGCRPADATSRSPCGSDRPCGPSWSLAAPRRRPAAAALDRVLLELPLTAVSGPGGPRPRVGRDAGRAGPAGRAGHDGADPRHLVAAEDLSGRGLPVGLLRHVAQPLEAVVLDRGLRGAPGARARAAIVPIADPRPPSRYGPPDG